MDTITKFFEGKCMWAKLDKPQQAEWEDVPYYSIEVEMDKRSFSDLQKSRILHPKKKLKVKEDGSTYIQFKKKSITKDGREIPGPKVIDADLNPLTCLIGNGSLVKIKVDFIPYTFMGKDEYSPRIQGVQVLDLVKYSGGSDAALEGFEATGTDII